MKTTSSHGTVRSSWVSSALSVFALSAVAVLPVSAHDYIAGGIQIDHPWTKPTAQHASVGAGYMLLRNHGNKVDRLMMASSPAADRVEIHETSKEGGVMRMRAVMGLEIWSGGMLEMKPQGYHIMFIGLKQPINQGDKIKATLEFEQAGKVDVEFEAQSPNSAVAAHKTLRPANEILTGTLKPKQ
jgi:periplasmic copper chaperone A